MTRDMFEAVVAAAEASFDEQGVAEFPEETTLTLHLAHDGASLAVPRVVAVTIQDDLVKAEADKGEISFVSLGDVFAASLTVSGRKAGRKAGFLR